MENKLKIIEIDPDPENIAKMRIELRECGVTESVIFPCLESFASPSMYARTKIILNVSASGI